MSPAEAFTIIAVFGTIGATAVFLGRWIMAHQVEMKRLELEGAQPARAEELDALRADVESVRAQLAEVQERLDFTERLLAQSRDKDLLKRGS